MFKINRKGNKVNLTLDITKVAKAIDTAKALTVTGLDKAGKACYGLADKING